MMQRRQIEVAGWTLTRLGVFIFFVMLYWALVVGAFFSTAPIVGAYSPAHSGGAQQPANRAEAIERLSWLCVSKNAAVAHAGWVSDVKLETGSGKVTYSLNTVWGRCSTSVNTASYAITGYPAVGGLTVCPNVGTYGNDMGNPTHDCAKYQKPNASKNGGPWELWCNNDHRPDGDRGRFYGNACISAGFKNSKGPDSKTVTGTPVVFRQKTQPTQQYKDPHSMTISLSGQISDWTNKYKNPGSATLGGNNALCSYYWLADTKGNEIKPNPVVNHGGRFCQNVSLNVSWGYALTPSVTNMPKTVTTDTFKPTTSIVRSGAHQNTADNTQWQSTRLIVPKGQTLAYPEHSSVLVSDHDPCKLYKGSKAKILCDRLDGEAKQGPIAATGLNRTPTVDVSGGYSTGDKVCIVMSVKNRSHYYANWNHAIKCSGWGKSPKVQVWGGDLQVGRVFSGHSSNVKAKIETGLTRKTVDTTHIVSATSSANGTGDISGLWLTGVDNNSAKRGVNLNDSHWQVRTVVNRSGKSTCSKGWTQGGVLQGPSPSSNTGNVNWQAVTVDDSNVWRYNPANSRWLSLNRSGLDYGKPGLETDCVAPAKDGNQKDANTYVFQLKNGINIKDSVNLDSISLSLKGAVDNLVKFYVNGQEIASSSDAPIKWGFDDNGWQEPGWNGAVSFGATGKRRIDGQNAFKHGNNTFEVHVRSDWSHTGLLIREFKMSATKSEPVKANQTFGSWGEYALISPATIRNMASGSGLNNGAEGHSSEAQTSWSRMTFGNSDIQKSSDCLSDSGHGCYVTKNHTLPDPSSKFTYAAAKTVDSSGGTWNVATLTNQNRSDEYRNIKPSTNGELRLTGGAISKGKWLVINAPNSTIRVTQNISYTSDPLSSNMDIPQLIVIAKNILIDSSVTQVDAWLVAKSGGINTCGDGPLEKLSSGDCSNQLRVNGPVISDKLYLRRTAGSEAGNLGEPAEIFNLRPDAHLWINDHQQKRVLRTTSIKELPPRY